MNIQTDTSKQLTALYSNIHRAFYHNTPNLLERMTLIIHLEQECNSSDIQQFQDSLSLAFQHNRLEVVALLLSLGVEDTDLKLSKLSKIIIMGTLEELKEALTKDNIEEKDSYNRTPFLIAVMMQDKEKSAYIHAQGADITVCYKGDRPVIFSVIENENIEMIEWLISLGLDIDKHTSYDGTALHFASSYGKIHSVKKLLSLGAKLECEYLYTSSYRKRTSSYIRVDKAIEKASTMEIVNLLVEAGADIKDISRWMREELLGVTFDISVSWLKAEYHQYKYRTFGSSNPQKVHNPFWMKMLNTNRWAGGFRTRFDDNDFKEPIWCYERYGRSISILADGRVIEIGGEHEDFYDPDFCIYNDVTVFHPNHKIEMYAYPKELFAPTDGHTATLVGEHIYIIGNNGYMDERQYGYTPVYRLNITDYSIEKIETTGEMAGWIYNHKAVYDGNSSIMISRGNLMISEDKEIEINRGVFILDLESLMWRKVY